MNLKELFTGVDAELTDDQFKSVKASITALDASITDGQKKLNDAIASRDSAKTSYKDVLSKLGTDVKGVDDFIKSMTAKKDDVVALRDATILALTKEAEESKSKHTSALDELSKQNHELHLVHAVAKAVHDLGGKANSAQYIKQSLPNSFIENGDIKFKSADGTTLRINQKDASLADVVSEMKNAEIESKSFMFFNDPAQQSGSDDNNSGSGGEQDIDI